MKKPFLLSLAIVACQLLFASGFITLNNIKYTLDTLDNYPVGPGCEYLSIHMARVSDHQGIINAFLLKVDAKNPYMTFQGVLGKDQVVGTETTSGMGTRISTPTHVTIGGTNGDFFATSGDIGRPTSLTVVNSEFAYIPDPSNNHHIGAIGDDNRGYVSRYNIFSGFFINPVTEDTVALARVNYKRNTDELVLYNHYNGATTATNEYGTEVALKLNDGQTWKTNGTFVATVVAKEQNKGSMAIQSGQFVLSGHGTSAAILDKLNVNDQVKIVLGLTLDGKKADIAQSIGADNYNFIIKDGQTGMEPYWNELHPRTGFGYSRDADTILFCVVDGRSVSVGCTTKVLGEIMKHNGAWNAVNWDGGGSSHLWLGGGLGLMNAGCEASERACGNGMFAVANVPTDDQNISSIYSYWEPLRMPKYGMYSPEFLGYNQYGLLINKHVEGVTISCDPEVGYINDEGAFVALGNGVVHATLGTVTHDIPVYIAEGATIAMRLDSAMVTPASHYPVEVVGAVGNHVITLHPSALTWRSADPSVATVTESGVLTGVSTGHTYIYGTLGDFTDSLLVSSFVPTQNPLPWDNLTDDTHFSMKASVSSWNATLAKNEENKTLLSLNFTGGRNSNIKFSSESLIPGDPDSLEIRFNPNGMPVEKVAVVLQAHNATNVSVYQKENIDYTKPVSVIVPIDEFLEVERDYAIFPLQFSSFTFYLNTSVKGEFTADIDGVYLYYGDVVTELETIPFPQNTDKAQKVYQNGQLYILKDGRVLNILGQEVY